MLNYKKVPTANLEVIKEEINTAFVQLSGWNSYEEFINYKNVLHAILKLPTILDIYSPATRNFLNQFVRNYGELKSISLNIFKRGGRIPTGIAGTPPELTGPTLATLLIPMYNGPVVRAWYNYTGTFNEVVLDQENGLNMFSPSQEALINHEENAEIDQPTACNVSKLNGTVNLKPGVAVFLACTFANQEKLLNDLLNDTIYLGSL